jgi:hypothetical protein
VRREQLRHVLLAASDITGDSEFVVVGSQAILGSFQDRLLPAETTASMGVDILPVDDQDGREAAAISGAIGESTVFHRNFGVYADGVDFETTQLPAGWESRLVPFASDDLGTVLGLCLDPADLAASKLLARRDEDYEYVKALFDAQLIDPAVVRRRLETISPSVSLNVVKKWVDIETANRKASPRYSAPPKAHLSLLRRAAAAISRLTRTSAEPVPRPAKATSDHPVSPTVPADRETSGPLSDHAVPTNGARSSLCNKWMPRAGTHCVCVNGHSGHCRSRS